MPPRIVIAEDEPSIRAAMSLSLAEAGYIVRLAEDGISALCEIRRETPEILLSDLNMPGMSGRDLLSVVRQRFPAIRTIAMSGAFSGDEVPLGIAADAFYEKGTGEETLLQAIRSLLQTEWRVLRSSNITVSLSTHRNGHSSSSEASLAVACPECQRSSPLVLDESGELAREMECAFCCCPIRYAVT